MEHRWVRAEKGEENVLDMIYRLGWAGVVNVVIAAIIVYAIRAVFVLWKKKSFPCIWGLVFAAALCPVEFPGFPCSGYVVEALIGSSLKFYFFLVWEGIAAVLLLWAFFSCRRIKWRTLDGQELEKGVFLVKGLRRARVCGFWHPVIYVPEALTPEVQAEVIARKKKGIASGAHRIFVCGCVITCLNWFHPILWFSLYYMKHDMNRL